MTYNLTQAGTSASLIPGSLKRVQGLCTIEGLSNRSEGDSRVLAKSQYDLAQSAT